MPHNNDGRNAAKEELATTTRKEKSWKDGFLSAIERNDVTEAIAVLNSQKTSTCRHAAPGYKVAGGQACQFALRRVDCIAVRHGYCFCPIRK